jgi:hypothetical protein
VILNLVQLLPLKVVPLALPDDHDQRLLLPGGQAEALVEVDVLGAHAGRQRPLEVVQQAGQRHLHGGQRERVPGAAPPAAAERQQLEVRVLEVDLAAAVLEPLRGVLHRVLPDLRVPAHGEGVDEDAGLGRDVVAAERAGGHGLPRHQQRDGRVEPERLLDDGAHVVELAEVRLLHAALAADDAPHLVLRLLEDARVPDQLRHHPLQRRKRRVRAGDEHVLQIESHGMGDADRRWMPNDILKVLFFNKYVNLYNTVVRT